MANTKTKAESRTATTKTTKSTNSTRKVAPANTYPLQLGKKVYNYTKLVDAQYSKLMEQESNYAEFKAKNFDLPITLREMVKTQYVSKSNYAQALYDYYQTFAKAYLDMETHQDKTDADAFVMFINYIHKYLNKLNELQLDIYKAGLDQAILDYKKIHIVDIEIESAKEKKQLQKEYEEAQAAKAENQKEQESEQSGSKA